MAADSIEVSVVTSIDAEEAVAALLERVSGLAPVLYTARERPTTKVTVYLDRRHRWTDARKKAVLRGLTLLRAEGLDVGPGRLRLRRLRAESWVNAWKRHFRPIEIGDALLLKPSWSRRSPKAAQAVVTLDPGLSFGTGQHPTTRFCLEQIVACRNQAPPPSLLDAGTGSGILPLPPPNSATDRSWPSTVIRPRSRLPGPMPARTTCPHERGFYGATSGVLRSSQAPGLMSFARI